MPGGRRWRVSSARRGRRSPMRARATPRICATQRFSSGRRSSRWFGQATTSRSPRPETSSTTRAGAFTACSARTARRRPPPASNHPGRRTTMRRPYIDQSDLALLRTLGLPGAGSGLRASDAERERAAEALRRHHADGRLTTDELEERTERAYASKTLGDLDRLFGDLPRVRAPENERRP